MKSDEIEKIPLQQVDTELVRYALDVYKRQKSVYLCEQYRRQGFACSESVCRALADIYEICLSEEIHKVISVFAGGAIDDGRCGIIEAGLLITSLLLSLIHI